MTRGIGSFAFVGALGVASFGSSACSSNPPPEPRATVPETPPAAAATEPRGAETAAAPLAKPSPGAPAPSATSAATPQGRDTLPSGSFPPSCHVTEELTRAFDAMNPGGDAHKWIAEAGARLLEPDVAERALTGVSQEILSALAHRRYDKLAAFAAPAGICMRAAKGAECRMLGAKALAGCSASRIRSDWPGKTIDEASKYSCGEAFKRIFYNRDYLHAPARFNCFPDAGRGNKATPIILSGPHFGYVEAHTESEQGSGSLWFVFDGKPEAPELIEMIADCSRDCGS